MLTQQILTLVGGLTDPFRRLESAKRLAEQLGVTDLIVFVVDPSLKLLLPAPMFPQTLPEGRKWREFLSGCTTDEPYTATLASPYDRHPVCVVGMRAADGSLLVLLGGKVQQDAAREICLLLPLVTAPLQAEGIARAAQAKTTVVSEAATKSDALVQRLDETRRRLQQALSVTEQQRNELNAQRQWFEVTLSSIGDAVITTDVRGHVTFLNPVAEKMTGWVLAEAKGLPLDSAFSIFHEETRERAINPVVQVLRDGITVGLANHTVLISKQGNEIAIEDSAAPIRNHWGGIEGAVMVFHDVSHRRRIEQSLKEETRVLEILNQTGRELASSLESQALVQAVTDAGTKLSGAQFGAFFYNVTNDKGESYVLYTLSGAPKEAFEKFGLPRNTPVFEPTFRGAGVMRSGDITKDPRYGTMAPHHGMPKGHLPVKSYLAVPIISRNGDVIGGLFFGHSDPDIFSDRTEQFIVGLAGQAATAIDNARLYESAQREIAHRKRAEAVLQGARDEAERANRAKDEFLAIVSHELRTPLTSVMGWTRMLLSGKLDASKTAYGIGVIERNVKLQSQVIEDLLDVSRVIAGKLTLTLGPVNIAKVITSAIEAILPSAEQKQIKITVVNEDVIETLIGDAGRLQQVIWNLLSNAVKFTPERGFIEIRTRKMESMLQIKVTDTGKGIAAEFLPRLFERFTQLDSKTTRTHGGLGLGLAIVQNLVEQHGGQVNAISDGPGRGTVFIVEIPIKRVEPGDPMSTIGAASPMAIHRPLSKYRILVVEDQEDSRNIIQIILETAGASCVAVGSVAAAMQELDRSQPHAILSDIGMPQQDGYDLIKLVRARAEQNGGKILAVALTAFAREEDRAKAIDAGFDCHIVKPIDPTELVRKLNELLQNR